MHTDAKRLQQIIKNLLSNAFKFTQHGHVSLTVAPATPAGATRTKRSTARSRCWRFRSPTPASAFRRDKQQIIFEAFQQADGSTSRKYGGTGLGLAISREIARLLGGEIRLHQRARQGEHVHALPAANAHAAKTACGRLLRPPAELRRPPRRSRRSSATDEPIRRVGPAQRGGRRSRQDPTRRSGAADRRQRSEALPAAARSWRARRDSRGWSTSLGSRGAWP